MQLNQIQKQTNKISELNYKISQIRKWSFYHLRVIGLYNKNLKKKKKKKIENDLSINLHNQLISEFIGEFKNFEIKKEEKEKSENTIKLDKQNKILEIDIGKIVGFIIKINANFGSSKNNFASKF